MRFARQLQSAYSDIISPISLAVLSEIYVYVQCVRLIAVESCRCLLLSTFHINDVFLPAHAKADSPGFMG